MMKSIKNLCSKEQIQTYLKLYSLNIKSYLKVPHQFDPHFQACKKQLHVTSTYCVGGQSNLLTIFFSLGRYKKSFSSSVREKKAKQDFFDQKNPQLSFLFRALRVYNVPGHLVISTFRVVSDVDM